MEEPRAAGTAGVTSTKENPLSTEINLQPEPVSENAAITYVDPRAAAKS